MALTCAGINCNPCATHDGRLFATLGRRNKVRTLSKKAISNVDIRAACRFIVSPDHRAPLRISSQLMAGLARVYVSQVRIPIFHSLDTVADEDIHLPPPEHIRYGQ